MKNINEREKREHTLNMRLCGVSEDACERSIEE